MTTSAPLTLVVINLHESAKQMLRLLQRLGLDPKDVTARVEQSRTPLHAHFRDNEIQSLFPASGLRRVRAPRLVDQLLRAGFQHLAPTLVADPQGKMSLEFPFAKNTDLPTAPHTERLGVELGELIWRRSRASISQLDGELAVTVDLVQLQEKPKGTLNELRFHPVIGLEFGPFQTP